MTDAQAGENEREVVDPGAAKHRIERAGKAYHFCCAHCADTFAKDPEHYLRREAGASGSTSRRRR